MQQSKSALPLATGIPRHAGEGAGGDPHDARGMLRSLLLQALESVRGEHLIARHSQFDGAVWRYRSPHASFDFEIPEDGRLFVVGAGKATASLSLGMERIFGDRIADGCIVVKYGHTEDLTRIRQLEAGHPIPDRNGLEGTKELLALLRGLTPRDRVVVLLSGGASSLLVAPVSGVSLEEKSLATEVLISSGADIHEINAVRKALSSIKGGGLLDWIEPASSLTLLISDVPSGDSGTVGSGPTIPGAMDHEDLVELCRRYRLQDKLPPTVLAQLTRKSEHVPLSGGGVANHAVATLAESRDLVEVLMRLGEAKGFHCELVNAMMHGQTHDEAKAIVDAIRRGDSGAAPRMLIAAGETTLEVTGGGKGGRNQEFALYAAGLLDGADGVCLLSAGTDGTDGPTDAAGAFIDGNSWSRARDAGLDPLHALQDNDSYPVFEHLGDLLITGPTGTNVMDIVLALVAKSAADRRSDHKGAGSVTRHPSFRTGGSF